MARIRSIKPEFPQSESMGRVSRDARLCFILLWTLADDSGRLRGSSRMLASLLFPYDEDAPGLIEGWLDELELQACVTRYQVGSDHYLVIVQWYQHQKVDRPTSSKIPSPPINSSNPREPTANPREPTANPREPTANPRESSCGDLRIGSKDQGRDQGKETARAVFDEHLPSGGKTLNGATGKPEPPPSLGNGHDHAEPGEPAPGSGTRYGLAALAMRQQGMGDAHPGDLRLRALVDAEVDIPEFEAVASEAIGKRKGFAWALTALANRRAEVAANPIAERPEADWRESRDAVSARGQALGLGAWCDVENDSIRRGVTPSWQGYKRGVIEADAAAKGAH